mmetsp:Transcript_97295/g.261376  ORF Transcript_97295/g.261376 Transcript_97295/m.261376 type:complete len:274 (-) Transcript_97295:39-860(-)
MRLHNADVDEADRGQPIDFDGSDCEEEGVESFFDLRQRVLVGMDQMSAFRIVALGVLRKLRTNVKGTVLYGEVEDALGRYFRLLDADMQKFASLHETLRDAADKYDPSNAGGVSGGTTITPRGTSSVASALAAASAILLEAMREIAVVLLACGEMQRRALDLKMTAQRAITESRERVAPSVSFSKFVEFLEEALAVCDQLRRKHEELHQQRMRAMAAAADARVAASKAGAAPGGGAASVGKEKHAYSPPPRDTAAAASGGSPGRGPGTAAAAR